MITTMNLAMSFSSSSAKVVSGSGFPRSISSSEHKVSQIGALRLLDQPHVAPTAVRLSQRRSSVKPVNANGESESNGPPEQPPPGNTGSSAVKSDVYDDPNNGARRIKLPIFMGEDPDGWVYRIERYFNLYNISTDEEKLKYVPLAMEGEALAWYRWEDGRGKFKKWDEVKMLLLTRFRPTKGGTLLEQFLAIRQESTVREYRRLFEQYAAPLKEEGIEKEEVLRSVFVNGLKPDIREELRLKEAELKTLEDVMQMAQRIEDKNIALRIRTGNGRIIP